MSKTFAVVHNTVTPYRAHLFRILSEELSSLGWRLHVHFLTRSLQGRPAEWGNPEWTRGFAHTFWPSASIRMRGSTLQFNPGLIAHLYRQRPDMLMIGGPWASITGALIAGCNRAHRTLGWFEGNTKSIGTDSPIAYKIKRRLLRNVDYCVVPGLEGVRMVGRIFQDAKPPATLVLRNVIDESVFWPRRQDDRAVIELRKRWGCDAKRLAIWPARLIPAKGICEFLEMLTPRLLREWHVVIFGEGPLRSEVERTIDRNLRGSVSVCPPESYGSMPASYRAADLFLLPSLRDPNPLSVIEALHSGLPLLVSNRIGNYDEAIEPNRNGWSFDPSDAIGQRHAAEGAFLASEDELRRRGAESARLAQEQWNSRHIVRAFAKAAVNGY